MTKPRVQETKPGRFLDVDEFAAALKLHPGSVRRLLRAGRIHGVRIGPYWRIHESQLANIEAEGIPA